MDGGSLAERLLPRPLMTCPAARVVDADVASDGVEPRRKRGPKAIEADGAVRLDQRLLSQIGSIVLGRGKAGSESPLRLRLALEPLTSSVSSRVVLGTASGT